MAWRETPYANIVSEQSQQLDTESVVDWCNRNLDKQQRIAGISVVGSLPRNPNGKILKRELRQQFKHIVF